MIEAKGQWLMSLRRERLMERIELHILFEDHQRMGFDLIHEVLTSQGMSTVNPYFEKPMAYHPELEQFECSVEQLRQRFRSNEETLANYWKDRDVPARLSWGFDSVNTIRVSFNNHREFVPALPLSARIIERLGEYLQSMGYRNPLSVKIVYGEWIYPAQANQHKL